MRQYLVVFAQQGTHEAASAALVGALGTPFGEAPLPNAVVLRSHLRPPAARMALQQYLQAVPRGALLVDLTNQPDRLICGVPAPATGFGEVAASLAEALEELQSLKDRDEH